MRKRNTLILVATIVGMLVAGIVPASMILHSSGTTAAAAPGGHFNAGKAVGTSMRAATSIDESKVPQATKAQIAAVSHKALPILGNQQKMASAKAAAKTGPANTATPERSAPAARAGSGPFTPGAQQ